MLVSKKPRPAAYAIGLWAFVIGAAITGGCAKREPIKPTSGMSESTDGWMRVLLFGNRTECDISAPGGFIIRAGQMEAGVSDARDPISVQHCGNRFQIAGMLLDGPITIQPGDPFVFFVNGQGYRGNLTLQNSEDPNGFAAINRLPMEAYLLGVVGAEMYSYWEPQALKAQAVAARTYALYSKKRFGKNRDWDVTVTQANQVYRGLSAESAPARNAVETTTGMVLVCSGSNGNDIFPTYYSSICGGHTEDSRSVFGESFSALCGVECPYCEKIARQRFWSWGPLQFSLTEMADKLFARYPAMADKLTQVASIELIRIGTIGRVIGVQIHGTNGKKDFLRGEDFRLALDSSGTKLKSAVFKMQQNGMVYTFSDGRGFGHGVGLCQTGAEYMARQGKTFDQILAWYYPGSEVIVQKLQ